MVTIEVPVAALLEAANVSTLVDVVGLVPNVAVTPLGTFEAARDTLPVNPPEGVTVIVLDPLAPCAMLKLAGLADRVKLGLPPATIVRVMAAVSVTEPPVPVIVMGKVPVAALLETVRVRTLVDVVGLVPNVAVTPLGRVEVVRDTLPVNPPEGVTVIVLDPLAPCAMLKLAGLADRVKLGVPPVPIVRVIVAARVIVPLVAVMVTLLVLEAVPFCTKKATDAVPPGQFTDDGLKFACAPEGRLPALSETLPVSPPTQVMVRVLVPWVPGATVRAAGEAETEKLGSAVTFKVKVVDSVVDPLVPVTVTVAAPTVAVFDAVKVRVLPEEPVTLAGLKLPVTPAGSPLTVKFTAPLKPPSAFTVTLLVPVVPCITVAPVADRLKPGPVVEAIAGKAF